MRSWLAAILICSSVVLFPKLAEATDPGCPSDSGTHVGSGASGFGAGVHQGSNCGGSGVDSQVGLEGTWHQEPLCTNGACVACDDGQTKIHYWITSPDGTVLREWSACPGDPPPPRLTTTDVANAFRRIDLPDSELVIQPPDGKTLVNFETNFYTEAEPFNRTVRLLGQQVELRIETHSFTWHFDDGDSVTTEEPGTPYPKLTVTHDYLQVGQYSPSVDTTWVADFRVNGGPWRPVPGSVTIDGDPVGLRAIEAQPTLVGYDG